MTSGHRWLPASPGWWGLHKRFIPEETEAQRCRSVMEWAARPG